MWLCRRHARDAALGMQLVQQRDDAREDVTAAGACSSSSALNYDG
jgi:hypothetical protein